MGKTVVPIPIGNRMAPTTKEKNVKDFNSFFIFQPKLYQALNIKCIYHDFIQLFCTKKHPPEVRMGT